MRQSQSNAGCALTSLFLRGRIDVFRWFTRIFSRKPSGDRAWLRPYHFLRARYDAAATNDDNRRHWGNADGLSVNAANSPEVRRVLRNRARYEVANNSYAKGICLTLA